MKGNIIMQLTPEQVQSVNILLNAVQVAQQRGAFSLQDAHTLQEAVDKLVPRDQQVSQESQEESSLSESDSTSLVSGDVDESSVSSGDEE